MLRTSDSETEILLGNKQIAGIFFAGAILLGVAFYGGYKVGLAGTEKKSTAPSASEATATAAKSTAPGGGETHSFPADSSSSPDQRSTAASNTDTGATPDEPVLGSPKHKAPTKVTAAEIGVAGSDAAGAFTPAAGQEFLQVAAVGKDEAEAIADVLHKKGFRAHAVPKPGSAKLYRVLIGPMQDAGDLSATRDALRKTGFREVIVQRY